MISETPQSAFIKAQWEGQLALVSALNTQMLDSMTNLLMLNIQTAREAFGPATSAWQKLLSASSSETQSTLLFAMPMRLDSAIAYRRQVAGIAESMGEEMRRQIHARFDQVEQQLAEQYEALAQQVPTGARGAFDALHAAFDNARKGYQEVIASSERAVHTLAASLNGADSAAPSPSAKKGAKATSATPAG